MIGDNLAEEVETLEWSVRLWERDPMKRWAVIIVSFVGAVLGYYMFSHVLFGLIAFVCIAGSSAEFIFPLKYHLDERVARVRCGISVTEIEWSAIKRAIEGSDGVKLSPLATNNRLAPFRGVYLRYANNRDAVLDYVKRCGGESARLLGQ